MFRINVRIPAVCLLVTGGREQQLKFLTAHTAAKQSTYFTSNPFVIVVLPTVTILGSLNPKSNWSGSDMLMSKMLIGTSSTAVIVDGPLMEGGLFTAETTICTGKVQCQTIAQQTQKELTAAESNCAGK